MKLDADTMRWPFLNPIDVAHPCEHENGQRGAALILAIPRRRALFLTLWWGGRR